VKFYDAPIAVQRLDVKSACLSIGYSTYRAKRLNYQKTYLSAVIPLLTCSGVEVLITQASIMLNLKSINSLSLIT